MKKNLSLIVSTIFFTFSLILVKPVHAQDQNFSLSNIFTKFRNSIQRFYLKTMPGDRSGQAVLKQSFYQLEELTSLRYEAEIQIKEETEEPTQFNLTLSGPAAVNNPYQPQSGELEVRIEGEVITPEESSSFAADLITKKETLYVRLEQLPTNFGQDFSALTGQWISLPLTMDEVEETEPDEETLTQQQQQELSQATLNLLEQARISQARQDSLNDEAVFVVDVSFEQEALSNYIKEVNQITDQNMTETEEQEMEKQLSQITPLNFTLWIGQSDFYPRQIETSLQLTDLEEQLGKSLGEAELGRELTPSELQVQLTISFSQFNQPIEITAPESAKSFEEILGQLLGFGFGFESMPGEMPTNFMPGMMPPQPTEKTVPNGETEAGMPKMPEMDTLEQQQQLLEQYGF